MNSRTCPTVLTAGPQTSMVEPYLHVDPGRIYNPITDRTLSASDSLWPLLQSLQTDPEALDDLAPEIREDLEAQGWIVDADIDPARRFRLRFVSVETHTVCNQKCYFCPVAFAPRESYFMPTETFERIISELEAFRDTLEGVFVINYNEPTVDRRFVDQCRTVLDARLPLAVNTNGTGLTPGRVDQLMKTGVMRFLQINLSTIDREEYQRTRGVDQLDLVLRNLEYAKHHRLAEEMAILVLGEHDDQHDRNFAAIQQRFAEGLFEVRRFDIMDRAGHLDVGLKPERSPEILRGCENLGSRPLQHLHVSPQGECLLCCEDYDEKWKVGDLNRESIVEVLTGDRMAQLRSWIYGATTSPEDFICRGCIYARS